MTRRRTPERAGDEVALRLLWLRAAGQTLRAVAAQVGISHAHVNDIAKAIAAEDMAHPDPRASRADYARACPWWAA